MRSSAFLSLLLILIFVSMIDQALSQTPIDVFFIAGQSNAAGRITENTADSGDENYSPLSFNSNDASVQYYYNTDGPASIDDQTSSQIFTTLQSLPNTGYYGPEISAGRELVALGYNPAIIKITEGSTRLATDWNSREGGELWQRWASEVGVALDELSTQGAPIRLRGFLWLQGESDSGTGSTGRANNYEGRFRFLVEDIYGVLGSGAPEADLAAGTMNGLGYDTSELEFVTALIHPRVSPEGLANFENGIEPFNITNRITVRNAQVTVSNEGTNRSFFDTVDLDPGDSTTSNNDNAANDQLVDGVLVPGASGLQSDGTHFNPVANEQVGLRFAAAIGLLEPEILLGDCNQDSVVDFSDISPFITILAADGFLAEADLDGDGFVTFSDIGPFILVLAS